ncbi:Hypothetical predicted protein [Pelobates cultripes]|uniref:Uncharacterized protein n=1 Tax=Pelobates cultripes TaxID=61616 RepID=A0AAD1RGK9_PELCU|nr:Hypothetical predicted protein [Pelobates cultripes]
MAPIFRTRPEKDQTSNHGAALSDNDSEDSCSVPAGSLDAPLTMRDMREFMRGLKSYVAEELQKPLQPLHESLTDLAMWTHKVETKMEDTLTMVNTHDTAIQEFREQIRGLEEAQKD